MRFSVIIERDEDGYYVASVPELPGCYTQARTLDELMERVKEAVELYLEVEGPVAEGGSWSASSSSRLSCVSLKPLPADKVIKVLVRLGFKPRALPVHRGEEIGRGFAVEEH